MQLASTTDNQESSETQPILNHHCEIIPITATTTIDHHHHHHDIENIDESSRLVVNVDHPQCRICLDLGGEDLIAPCHCKGTQKYVHRSCLDNWRSTKEGFAFSHCTECRAVFIIRPNVPKDRWWLRLKFQFLVARDHAFIFIIVQLVVAFLGVLIYKFYGDELREMFGYEEHPYGFYTMAVLAIILVGLLYGFFIAIICGQRINERHYHVLAKQELTKVCYVIIINAFKLLTYNPHKTEACYSKLVICLLQNTSLVIRYAISGKQSFNYLFLYHEYVVEDREHVKDVPELDPSHVTELRMLGLY